MSCCGGHGGHKQAAKTCGCAGAQWAPAGEPLTPEAQKAAVRESYGRVAETAPDKADAQSVEVAKSCGYTDEQLASLPDGANMGLQCGNPTAIAELKPGEHVLDLGSGGGLDVFLVSKRVGPTGKAVGLDMTIEMIQRARAAAVRGKYTNVEFVLGEMEKMPLPANEFDCVISNCVVALSPDIAAVFREIMRVLKPGGRMVVSDIGLRKPLPDEIAKLTATVAFLGKAVLIDDYVRMIKAAGLERVEVIDSHRDLSGFFRDGCGCGSANSMGPEVRNVLSKYNPNDLAMSAKFIAYKPA